MATDPAFDQYLPAAPPGHAGLAAAQVGRQEFDVTLRIRRYDPESDAEPHWETYTVTLHRPTGCWTRCTR